MYAAMGAGTLVKGPIAVIIPAMVIFFCSFLTRQWRLIKKCLPNMKRNEKVFRVFLRERSLVRFSGEVGGSARILARIDEYLLVTNR